MQQDAGRVSSKSEQRPQYEQLRGSSSNDDGEQARSTRARAPCLPAAVWRSDVLEVNFPILSSWSSGTLSN